MRAISYEEFRAMRRFPAFDGLRAIAAALVFTFHFGGPDWGWTSGWIGVHLFFVLSGFLITTLLLREEERYGRVSLRGFYVRRLFRIMPVYLVVLAVTYALAHLNGTGDQVRRSLLHYLFLLNEFAPTSGFVHSWTIGIEQKFYLFWPVLAFVLIAGVFWKRIALTLAAIAALTVVIPTLTAAPFWPIHYIVILVGCLLAIVMHHPQGFAVVRPLTHPVVAVVVAAGFVGAHLGIRYWPPSPDGHVEPMLATYAVAAAILLPSLLSRSLPAKLLSLRPMVFVGERSYSLYLVQLIAASIVVRLVPGWSHASSKQLIATLLVGLAGADLLYRWVEQPMIRLGRRFATRRRSSTAEVPDRSVMEDDDSLQPDATAAPAGSAAPL